MATYNLGKVMMTPRGTYSASATYYKLDFVDLNGTSYVCIADSVTGRTPSSSPQYWQRLAAGGSGTLTPAQKQDIINSLIAEGVIIDPDYNNYSAAEKSKLAGLTAPNNGTLTINQDGQRLGTFTADQATNTTINVPAPNDPKITLINRTTHEPIGEFTLNQKESQEILVPVGEGGSATVGTLTLKAGATTAGTYSGAATTITLPPAANNGVLTLKKNNATIATFGANSSGNVTANFIVPNSVNDLSDGTNYAPIPAYYDKDEPADTDVMDGDCLINELASNAVYYCSNATKLSVKDYGYDTSKPNALRWPKTYIYVESVSDFLVDFSTLPNYQLVEGNDDTELRSGNVYLITVQGFVWSINKLV